MSEERRWLNAGPEMTEREDLPVRSEREYVWCLNRKHRRDLAGVNCGVHHALRVSTESCNRCWSLRLPRHTWLVVDHRRAVSPEQADQLDDRSTKLVILARRPAVPAGVGQLEVRLRGAVVAVADLQLCGADQRGVVRHVQVKPAHRRRGFGTLLVDAAQARGPGYHWSTTKYDKTDETLDFWANQDPATPLHLGERHYCTHMREANDEWG